jgi:O-antigen ligase
MSLLPVSSTPHLKSSLMILRLDNFIAIGILVVLCFAALAHGAVESWSIAIVKLLTAILVLLWGLKIILEKRLVLTIPAATWPLVAFLLLGLIQSVSFRSVSLSHDLEATRSTVAVYTTVLVMFVLSANFFANRERVRVMVSFLTFFGFALSVFALLQYFTWNGKFYWIRPTLSGIGSVFGPFANHNHFAGCMELLIGLPISLIVASAVRREERIFYGFLAAVIGITILLSLSRGGMVSLFVELMFIAFLSTRLTKSGVQAKISTFWRGMVVILLVATIFLGAIWIGADPVVNRVVGDNQDSFSTSRTWVWKDALKVFQSFPISGAGLGAFQTAYPRRSDYDGVYGYVAQAHNDYLQVLADGGIIGGVLALWFIGVVLRDVMRGMRAHDPLIAGMALGSGAGIVGLLTHSLFDFNLQLPSNAMLFLLLCAIASFCNQKVSEQEADVIISPGPRLNAPTFTVGVLG